MEISKRANRYYGALDLGGSFLKYAYGNLEDKIVYDSKIAIEDPQNIESVLNTIKKAIDHIKEMYPELECIGMGCPGTVNNDLGIITGVSPNIPGLVKIKLREEIEKRNKVRVFLENDANLMALSQTYFYPGKSILGITIGTGIGSGFVDKNGIFHGEGYSALEVGHTIVVNRGRKCKCGKQGCVEAYSSASSVLEIIQEKFPELGIRTIGELYDISRDNESVKEEVDRLNELLGQAISNAIMILNPSVVTIGGGVCEIESYDFIHLKKRILDNLLESYKICLIEKASLNNKAGIFGGVILAEISFSGI